MKLIHIKVRLILIISNFHYELLIKHYFNMKNLEKIKLFNITFPSVYVKYENIYENIQSLI